MKRSGVLHGDLSRIVALLCPGEALVLVGAALRPPQGVPLVDLAVTAQIPRLIDVLDAVLAEMRAERALVADRADPGLVVLLQNRLGVEPLPAGALQTRACAARAAVRTGDLAPEALVVLICGAPV